MRVGFFGGTFDPPHCGHLAVALSAIKAFKLDHVLLAPVASQPLKRVGVEAPFEDRLHMVGLLCSEASHLKPSAIDGPRNGPNYTIDTLHRLKKSLPGHASIFVIVGRDAFATLRQWRAPNELLALAEWIVVSRPHAPPLSFDGITLSAVQHAHVHPLEGVDEPASSTEIRARLHAGQDCSAMLPKSILEYILAHHLYGTSLHSGGPTLRW